MRARRIDEELDGARLIGSVEHTCECSDSRGRRNRSNDSAIDAKRGTGNCGRLIRCQERDEVRLPWDRNSDDASGPSKNSRWICGNVLPRAGWARAMKLSSVWVGPGMNAFTVTPLAMTFSAKPRETRQSSKNRFASVGPALLTRTSMSPASSIKRVTAEGSLRSSSPGRTAQRKGCRAWWR